jgi:hypothetical protein
VGRAVLVATVPVAGLVGVPVGATSGDAVRWKGLTRVRWGAVAVLAVVGLVVARWVVGEAALAVRGIGLAVPVVDLVVTDALFGPMETELPRSGRQPAASLNSIESAPRNVGANSDWRSRVSPVAWDALDRLKRSFRPYVISGIPGYGY